MLHHAAIIGIIIMEWMVSVWVELKSTYIFNGCFHSQLTHIHNSCNVSESRLTLNKGGIYSVNSEGANKFYGLAHKSRKA